MGLYGERVFPRVMNVLMNTKETRQIRARVCAPLRGEVVEIGFGTGHNLPFMPAAVTWLRAVEPLMKARHLAAGRVAEASFPVEFVGLDGQQLPIGDRSADAVLSTWTLCSTQDPVAAVREISRILRPEGRLPFCRARSRSGRRRGEVAAPVQRNQQAIGGRLQHHPGHPCAHHRGRNVRSEDRDLLREGRSEAVRLDVRGMRHPGRRSSGLSDGASAKHLRGPDSCLDRHPDGTRTDCY